MNTFLYGSQDQLRYLDGDAVEMSSSDGEGSINYPEPMPDDIVVTASYRSSPGGISGGLNFTNFFHGRDYGSGSLNEDPFIVVASVEPQLSASEIVARAAESLALAIKTLTNLSRPVLPANEERRLDALAFALEKAAIGLKAGDIDLATAKTSLQSGIAVALDTLTGAGMGVMFGALGAWATTLTPSPVLKALGTVGFGAVGLAADWYISDTGAAQSVASTLTNALFNGAQALSDTINNIVTLIVQGFNPVTGLSDPVNDRISFQLESNGVVGHFDGDTTNGTELYTAVYHAGLGNDYLFTTNPVMNLPRDWNYGDPVPLPSDRRPLDNASGIGGGADTSMYENESLGTSTRTTFGHIGLMEAL